jgi:hypothetical protein
MGFLKNDFENLGKVLYSTEMFSGNYFIENGEKGGGGFMKRGIVYNYSPNQFIPCSHITLVWDGA